MTEEATQPDPIREKSDMLLRILKQTMGADLDYSMYSLLHLDKVLEHLGGPGMSRISADMVDFRRELRIGIACYFGECIRMTFSGQWGQDETRGLYLEKVANQNIMILPVNTAEERLSGDDTKIFATAMAIWYEVFKQMREKVYGPPAAPQAP